MSTRRALTDAALYLLALSACWPLIEVVRGSALWWPGLAVVTVVVAAGVLARALEWSATRTVSLQLLALLLGATGVFLVRGGSPSLDSVRSTLRSAREVANGSVAPLSPVLGIVTLLAVGAGLIALVIDYVGGTARMPLLAALPVAAPFVLATVALGDTLRVRYFVVAAVAWAFLVLVTTTSGQDEGGAIARTLPLFAVMTGLAVLAALALGPSVPHRATPALAKGGARGVDTTVDFTESLDLSKSLRSRNGAPVLTYTTTATSPAPLRVTTSSNYTGGQWRAQTTGPFTEARSNTELPNPGATGDAPSTTSRISVTLNGMKAPLVSAPAPLRAANFGDDNASFRFGTNNGVPLVSRPAPAYSVLYREYTSKARPSSNEKTGVSGTVTAEDLDTSSLPQAAKKRIDDLTNAAGATAAGTPFEAAIAVQRYLRTDPSFRYSLELAPTSTVAGAPLDPLSHFLDTRQGYCTQFATTMVMSARTLGIPARLAVGFLPGTERASTFEVRAADAHAWVELYFPGLGWTRFDPTPGVRSGAAPPYAPDTPPAGASVSSAPSRSTSVAPKPSATRSTTTSTSTTTTKPAQQKAAAFPWKALLAGTATGALVVGLLSVLPLAGRRRRGALLRRAGDERERDEGVWYAMVWSLRDLGYTVRDGLSPRATLEAFDRDNPEAGSNVRAALERACTGMEASRYSSAPGRSQASACGRVVRAAKDEASARARIVAAMVPASGRAQLRGLLRRRKGRNGG